MPLNSRYYNPETFNYQNTPYVVPDTGRAQGNQPNIAQQQIGADIGAGVVDIASTAIGAGLQSRSMNEARETALRNAEQTRGDQLKQQNIDYNLKRQIQQQDIKRFELDKLIEEETLRHNTWLFEFQKALENDKFLTETANNIFSAANKSEDIKNIILSNFRRKR